MKALGLYHSSTCQAIHTNMAFCAPNFFNPWHIGIILNAKLPLLNNFPLLLSAKEAQSLKDMEYFQAEETGPPALPPSPSP